MFTSTILFGMKLYLINRIQYSLPYNENRAEQGRKVELRGSMQKPGQPTIYILLYYQTKYTYLYTNEL